MNAPSWCALGDVLREHAIGWPAATALVCGDQRLSWAQLDERVDRLAGSLTGLGLRAGDRVLWLGQNCHRVLELLLAAGRLGAALCPVNWRQSPGELAFVIDDLEPRVVVWQGNEIGERVAQARALANCSTAARWVRHDGAGLDSYEALIEAGPAGDGVLADTVDPEAPVLILYTAAFEGRPNGALLAHRALQAQGHIGMLLGLASRSDVYLNSGPLFHVGTFRMTVSVLMAGGTNVFTPRVDADELCRLIAAEGCTGAFLQPPTIGQIVALNRDGRYNLSTLRAKPGPPEWNAMVSVEGRQGPSSGYGQTELAGAVTYVDPGRPCLGKAGRPGPLARVEVVDPTGRRLPPGEVGELVVRGPMVMCGYHRRPELTDARGRGGWHHTGDLGRREADGSLSFVAPMTRIIKSAAENIYPAEVEACLMSHPAVAAAAVVGVPDPSWGQSVKAVVVLADGATADEADLISHCRDRIASYKKPRSVEFAASLPDRAGSVDYAALDARYGGGGYPGSGADLTPSDQGQP
jgi:acyl-CoA synthetase (AMP-forming)/AMP-acid ligase II